MYNYIPYSPQDPTLDYAEMLYMITCVINDLGKQEDHTLYPWLLEAVKQLSIKLDAINRPSVEPFDF